MVAHRAVMLVHETVRHGARIAGGDGGDDGARGHDVEARLSLRPASRVAVLAAVAGFFAVFFAGISRIAKGSESGDSDPTPSSAPRGANEQYLLPRGLRQGHRPR